MNKDININPLRLGYLLLIKIFTNKIIIMILDLLLTTLISIHTSQYRPENSKWRNMLIIYIVILILVHVTSVTFGSILEKSKKYNDIIYEAYNIQSKLHNETTRNLYRINNKIINSIKEFNIQEKEFKTIYDFQGMCFSICDKLCELIVSKFDCKDCEVTVFQRFEDDEKGNSEYVKMIAYHNNQSSTPSSYSKKYYLDQLDNIPYFISIFNKPDANIVTLCNKKEINSNFNFLDESRTREQNICQYICVPIRTNRSKTEIILQIDVSKEKCFGRKNKNLKNFAEEVIVPFANIIHCNYEQDLLLGKYFTLLGSFQDIAIKKKMIEREKCKQAHKRRELNNITNK